MDGTLRRSTASKADERVIAMAAYSQLNRIGDHFPRHERRLHSLVAHCDAIGHGDCTKLARRAARRNHTPLRRLTLPHQSNVAGRGFVPAGRDANERLVNLLSGKSHGIEVGAVRRARYAFRHISAPEAL